MGGDHKRALPPSTDPWHYVITPLTLFALYMYIYMYMYIIIHVQLYIPVHAEYRRVGLKCVVK